MTRKQLSHAAFLISFLIILAAVCGTAGLAAETDRAEPATAPAEAEVSADQAPPPEGLRIALNRGTQVAVRWLPVKSPTEYDSGYEAGSQGVYGSVVIEVREKADGEWRRAGVEPSRIAHTVGDLEEGKRYLIRLRSCLKRNGSHCGPPSPAIEVLTATRPATPRQLAVTETAATAVRLSWQPGEGGGETERYEILWPRPRPGRDGAAPEFRWSPRTNVGGEHSESYIVGLIAGRSYLFKVRACNLAGCSEPSAEVSVTTKAAAPPGR